MNNEPQQKARALSEIYKSELRSELDNEARRGKQLTLLIIIFFSSFMLFTVCYGIAKLSMTLSWQFSLIPIAIGFYACYRYHSTSKKPQK